MLADDAWGCPPLGKGKERQPVSVRPVPLYFNEEMSPELALDCRPARPAATAMPSDGNARADERNLRPAHARLLLAPTTR